MSRGGLRTRACAATCHRRSGRCSGCQQWWHLSVSRISYGEIVTIRVPYHLLLLSNDFERPKRVVTLQFPQVRFTHGGRDRPTAGAAAVGEEHKSDFLR